jgi:hypothetical protein
VSRRDIDRIARVQHLRLLALEADAPDARQAKQRLADRVRVPGGARAWGKRHHRSAHARRRIGGDHRILEDGAREGLGGAPLRRALSGATDTGFDWHGIRLP